jgi:hypothetical protein
MTVSLLTRAAENLHPSSEPADPIERGQKPCSPARQVLPMEGIDGVTQREENEGS